MGTAQHQLGKERVGKLGSGKSFWHSTGVKFSPLCRGHRAVVGAHICSRLESELEVTAGVEINRRRREVRSVRSVLTTIMQYAVACAMF